MKSLLERLRSTLTGPVDNTFLIYFRMAFGGLMLWSLHKDFRHDTIWTNFIEPSMSFPFYGFDWVQPWPEKGLYVHFFVVAVAAACIAIGYRYTISSLLFFFGFVYIFLLDQSWYLNHYYLICLASFLLFLFPAQRAFSIDAWRDPTLRSSTAPRWTSWLLRFLFGLPYFYGGIAKINRDWLLAGEPIRTWLEQRAGPAGIHQFFTEDWCVNVFVWGGLLLDLFAVPFLLWRWTRLPMMMLLVSFHLLNSHLFDIGVFPWLMLAVTPVVFFPPEWIAKLRFWKADPRQDDVDTKTNDALHVVTVVFLSAFVIIQLLLPLRHWLYPGDVAFTREAHCFSWRMKLNERSIDLSRLRVHFEDGTNESIDMKRWMPHLQRERLRSLDQLLQLAQRIRATRERETSMRAEVRGEILAEVNKQPPKLLVTENVDLSRQPRGIWPAKWLATHPSRNPNPSQSSRESAP